MKKLLVVLMAFGLMSSCAVKERVVTVERVRTDTLRETRNIRDSIYLHDSVFVKLYERGETVYVEKERWHTRYKDRLKTDTVYISKRDTVIQAGEPLDTVDGLSWWDKARIWIGNIVLLAVFAAAVIWFYKMFK